MGCFVCTRGDRDGGGGGGRERVGGKGGIGLGWGVNRGGQRKEGDFSCCGALSDFGPDPAGCPSRCCLKLQCGPRSGPVH